MCTKSVTAVILYGFLPHLFVLLWYNCTAIVLSLFHCVTAVLLCGRLRTCCLHRLQCRILHCNISLLRIVVLLCYCFATVVLLLCYYYVTIVLLLLPSGRYRDLSSNLKTYTTLNQLPAELKDEMQEHLKLKFNNQEASDDQVLYCQPLSAASVWVCVLPAVSHCRPLLLVLLDSFQTQMQVRIQHESSWQAPSHAVALALFVRSCFYWVRALHCCCDAAAATLYAADRCYQSIPPPSDGAS